MADRELVGYTVAVNRPSSRYPGLWEIVGSIHQAALTGTETADGE